MMQKDYNDVSNLKISDEVIASITGIATKEIEGVADLVSATNLKGMFKSKPVKSPVLIDVSDDVAVIDVFVKIKQGAKVQTVASNIQKRVKDSVQNMTGIVVSKVNVHVCAIAFEDKK